MRFTLDQIVAFAHIVRLGSFHAAARQLGLTQPTVSQRIRELENALGVDLFVRRGPRINLTADGHALLPFAERLIGTAGEVVERYRSRDPLRGVLRLGATDSFAQICLVDLLHRLERQYPELKTSVHIENSGTMSRMLNQQELDIAIVSEPELAPHVHQEPIGCNELAWLASPELDLPRRPLVPADLASRHLILSPPPSRLYDTVMAWFAASGIAPGRVSTCNSLSVVVSTILSAVAIGVVPVRVMRDEIAKGLARRIAVSVPVKPHRVSICYQTSAFGAGIGSVVTLTRELILEHRLLLPLPAADRHPPS